MAQYPQWSYSQSRANMFDECLRKYYFHYYAAHNGWNDRLGSPEQVHAYRLKQLRNFYLLFGDLAHRMCESALRQLNDGKQAPRPEFLSQTMRQLLNDAYVQSKDRDAWLRNPKQHMMLSEVYYGDDTLSSRISTIRERQQECVRHLYATRTWQEVSQPGMNILEIEKWDHLILFDTKVYVKMDLLYRRPDHNVVIVDWKTGREDDFSDQLYLYASYVQEKYNLPLDQIVIRVEYLVTGDHQEYSVTREDIDRVERNIGSYIQEMKSCLDDDYYNRPKPETFFTPMPSARKCRDCNFREMCSASVV
ncbi:RecB family exonuclease [Paenibacillus sp. WLX2291]|uniref:RecB family exonuclease n=1 Tax=Paenibacillus sp. WLX2291 TaxID=3296934 RepID=UPI0039843EFB